MNRFYKAVFFIIPLFLASCSNEYWNYHQEKQKDRTEKTEASQILQSFDIGQIGDRNLEILTTPDKKVLDRIVAMLGKAERAIDIEVYILTEKRIISTLKEAKKRGVRVRVILEKNVYGATSINSKAFKTLTEAGIEVTYASNKLYNFTHSKLLLIDDKYIVTTGNLSYSSFTSNREFYIIGDNTDDLSALRDIFDHDFSKLSTMSLNTNLVISPENSRHKIEKILESARTDILLYAETFSDPAIIEILSKKRRDGVSVKICMADPKKIPANWPAIQELRAKDIDARTSKKPIIHAKAFVVDSSYSYIGSENFTANSLDQNREVGIIFKSNPEYVKQFKNTFYEDCPEK